MEQMARKWISTIKNFDIDGNFIEIFQSWTSLKIISFFSITLYKIFSMCENKFISNLRMIC